MGASYAGGFAPDEEPRIAVAADGSAAAIQESSRITLLELPSGAVYAEIGTDPEAAATDVAWLGTPPKLVVLSRYEAHSTVHLLDPSGPRSLSELRLEVPMQLAATVAGAALVIGQVGAAVLVATDTHIMPYQFATRVLPVAAGGAANQFVVGLSGSIEEWDPQTRMPKRRLRLPRVAAITAVGGSERLVWMTTQQEPARIDVIPLVNRGQPKAHDLPEPIARITGHPRSDLVACIGADTGRLYVVDLDGRSKMRTIAFDDIDRASACALIIGRSLAVIAAQAGRPICIAPLERREQSDPALVVPNVLPRMTSLGDDEPRSPSSLGDGAGAEPRLGSRFGGAPSAPPSPAFAASVSSPSSGSSPGLPVLAARPSPRSPAQSPSRATSASERFSAWRDQVRQNQRPEPITATPSSPSTLPATHTDPRQTWRDEVVAWTRAVMAGAVEHNAPAAPPIEALLTRFELAFHLQPALTLLYGAHLSGERGAAPIDVARILDRQWDEALGRGELAHRNIATFAGSRVALSPVIQRVLDELPPIHGTLIGSPGTTSPLLGPCVVVADASEPLTAIAERCLPQIGSAILVGRADLDIPELLFESRAYGAAPLLRLSTPPSAPPTVAAIFVLTDADLADRLELPRLA